MSLLQTEIWRVGVIDAPIQEVARAASLEHFSIKWIEADKPLCFLADPFGLWREGKLYLFAEAYDYRTKCGYIEAMVLDKNFTVVEKRVVLKEDWHLSYPYVFEAEGEIWMLPEGYKSGRLTLYKAVEFPWRWQAEPRFVFPEAAIDATPYFHAGRWWMFYTPPAPKVARTNTLKLATADNLFGPWDKIPTQTLREDIHGARMGGTPFTVDDNLVLPTQDCSRTYGGALQLLSLSHSALAHPSLSQAERIEAPRSHAPFNDGLHTLSQAGPVTLIDTKRTLIGSPHRLAIELFRFGQQSKKR